MVISEPQIKFPEGATVLRASDDPVPPHWANLLLCVVAATKVRLAHVSTGR